MRAIGKPQVVHLIEHNERAFRLESSFIDGTISRSAFVWAEVTTAVVFKRDCVMVDLICMVFGSATGVVEINEEMQEWKNVVSSLPKYLPGCLSQEVWFLQVATPAFAPNPMCIFRRDGAPVGEL